MGAVNTRIAKSFEETSGCKIIPVMALEGAIQEAIAKYYPEEGVFRDPILTRSFQDAEAALARFLSDGAGLAAADALVDRLEACYRANGKVLIAGNGGSMADAMHFAEEWTGRFRNSRRALPAMALADPTHLTCVANDFGFEHVFSRMVEAFARPEDLVILLSTSGNSRNLILAAEAARKLGAFVVGLLGRDGGKLAPLCDLRLIAPGDRSDRIQELHMLTLHAVIDAVEHRLGIA